MHAQTLEAKRKPDARGPRSAPSPIDRLASGRADYVLLNGLAPVQRIQAVKDGLPALALSTLADDLQVTRDQLYAWVGIPRATATRKLRLQSTLNQDESERVLGIARLIGQAQQIVAESGDDPAFDAAAWTAGWLSQPAAALGGRCPGEFVDTADGRELLSGLLARMQSGAYA